MMSANTRARTGRPDGTIPAEHARGALTWLFVPGDRPDRFAKATASGADAVILDLEDAVAPQSKAFARQSSREYLLAGNPAYVRVNGADSEYHHTDLMALSALEDQLRGVVLPKSEQVESFDQLDRVLPKGAVAVALIETAAGVNNAYEIAAAPRVARLAFGSADFTLQTGIEDEPRGLLLARSTLVVGSHAGGLEGPIDGITTALDDDDAAQHDAEDGRRLGFAGKLCLHPRQIAPVLRGFTPPARDVMWASEILSAAEGAGGRAIRVRGQMVDLPLLRRARQLMSRQQRIEEILCEAKEKQR
jgi:citrate lyase subunit beta/citryl-CoA lyase